MTYQQVIYLVDRYKTEDYNNAKFRAVLAGVDLGSDPSHKTGPKSRAETKTTGGPLLFGDPADYEKMSEKDREALTEKMSAHFQGWAGKQNLGAEKHHGPVENCS